MAREYATQVELIVLRDNVAAVTASADGTELTGARIDNTKSGVLVAHVAALTAAGDRVYALVVKGRDAAADAYVELGRFPITAAGVQKFSIDRTKKRMLLRIEAAGTTPSITVPSAVILGMELTSKPAQAAAIIA